MIPRVSVAAAEEQLALRAVSVAALDQESEKVWMAVEEIDWHCHSTLFGCS